MCTNMHVLTLTCAVTLTHTCSHIYAYGCMLTCMHILTHLYVCTHAQGTHAHTCAMAHPHPHPHVLCSHVHIPANSRACLCTCTQTRTHANVCSRTLTHARTLMRMDTAHARAQAPWAPGGGCCSIVSPGAFPPLGWGGGRLERGPAQGQQVLKRSHRPCRVPPWAAAPPLTLFAIKPVTEKEKTAPFRNG